MSDISSVADSPPTPLFWQGRKPIEVQNNSVSSSVMSLESSSNFKDYSELSTSEYDILYINETKYNFYFLRYELITSY